MIRGQMGIAQCHLKASVTQQLTDSAKICACHNQPTGKGVPIAMPSVVRELGTLENPIEPVSLIAQPIALRVHENPLSSWSIFAELPERRQRFLELGRVFAPKHAELLRTRESKRENGAFDRGEYIDPDENFQRRA
jgi:hypothetical protein